MASSTLMPTTFSNNCGETSTTRLTLQDLKKASASSSTAEVISVLPARFFAVPTALSSGKVPTITWAFATSRAMHLLLKPVRALSSISPGRPDRIRSLPLAYSSSWRSEVSMVGAPVCASASAKRRFGV